VRIQLNQCLGLPIADGVVECHSSCKPSRIHGRRKAVHSRDVRSVEVGFTVFFTGRQIATL